MGRGRYLPHVCIAVWLSSAGATLAGERFIAYQVPAGLTGNQDIFGTTSIGMDFDVNLDVTIFRLGVFDSGADGLSLPLTATLYDRDTALPMAALQFTPDDPGELVEGSRFKDLDEPLVLAPGFHGSISCYGQGGTEPNFNTYGGASTGLWSTSTGHCGISFVGGSRFGAGPGFPGTVDTGPVARYAAGTFEFEAEGQITPVPGTAYIVPQFSAGNFPFTGPLGMDFDVLNDIEVDQLGVFDSGSDDLSATLTATLYDRSTQAVLARLTFEPGDSGDLIDGSRFKTLPAPLGIPAGTQCTIVVEGYNDLEQAGNVGIAGGPVGIIAEQGGCSIEFVGSSRYGFLPGQFPTMPDFGPEVRYAAGTFTFGPPASALQRPATPTDVSAAAVAGGAHVTWSAPAGPAVAGYNVYTSSPGNPRKLNGAAVTQTQFTAAVARGADYCFVVRSVRADGIESIDSAETCINLPPGAAPATRYIAYQVPAGAVGQTQDVFDGTLGQDFETRTPVVITRLGVFDDGSDGLNSTLIARLFDRDIQGELASLTFTKQDPGDLVGGSRFKALDQLIVLPAGFRGTITAEGYSTVERYGNQAIAAIDTSVDDGGCALTFLGPRYGSAGGFPRNVPGWPPNPYIYIGGSFEYGVVTPPPAEPNSGIAFVVPAGTLGNQNFTGSLGLAFDVQKAIRVTRLGVFDDGSNGLNQPLTAIIYDRDARSVQATLDFTTDDPGELVGGSRFKNLPTPLDLSVGFHGLMVGQGYGALEMNGNTHGNQDVRPWTTFGGNCRIAFVGGGRHTNATMAFPLGEIGFPLTDDAGPVNRFAAGTFEFGPGPDADFTVSPGDEGVAPFQVTVNAGPSSSLNGAITLYTWDFGDGGIANGISPPAHSFTRPDRYKITLTVVDASGATAQISKAITVHFASGDVSPWTSADIGDPSIAGGARRDGGCLDVYAGGTNIGGLGQTGTSDHFHFVYQQFPGDGSIIAHFSEVDWETGAKLGVMFREDLTPFSRSAGFFIQNAATPKMASIRRATVGGTSSTTLSTATLAPPGAWLKIVKTGADLVPSYSTDGVTFVEEKKMTVSMPAGCFGGIAAASNESADSTNPFGPYIDLTAKVCDLQVTGIGSGAPAAPTGLIATPGDLNISLLWNANSEPDLQGYNVFRSEAGGPYAKINGSLVTQPSFLDTAVSSGTQYCYKVQAVNPGGSSPDSAAACATPVVDGVLIRRGDVDGTGVVELTDVINLIGFLFLGNPQNLDCFDAADADDTGVVELTDAIVEIGWLFLGSPTDLPAPGPLACGVDPTPDDLAPCGRACQ
jgi:PKD repeat protein